MHSTYRPGHSGAAGGNRDEIAENLTGHYLFSALNDEQIKRLRQTSWVRRLGAVEHLFVQGDRASAFWLLETGQIKLYRLSRDGHQKIMGLVMPGSSFAEGVLFMDNPRYPVNAEAIPSSVVHGFDRETYLGILETSFATCRGLFRQMVKRTQRHLDESEALTIQHARFRLAHYLLSVYKAVREG